MRNALYLLDMITTTASMSDASASASGPVRTRHYKQMQRQRQQREAVIIAKTSQLVSAVLGVVRDVDGDVGVPGSSHSTSISDYSSWVPAGTPTTTVTGAGAAIAYLKTSVAALSLGTGINDSEAGSSANLDNPTSTALSRTFVNMVGFIATELSQ